MLPSWLRLRWCSYQWVCEMSGSFLRCLVATAVLVTASSLQAAPEAPAPGQPVGQSAAQPAVIAEVQPVIPAAPTPAPAKAAEVLPTPAAPTAPSTPAAPSPIAEANPPAPQANPGMAPAPVQVMIPSNAGLSDEDRAKQILANEQRGSKPTLHALQKESPDYNIVVCEAGCGDSRAHIVYKKPVASIRSALADPATATAPLTKKAECRGGCDGNNSHKHASLATTAPTLLNDQAGSWMTTVEPSAAKAPSGPSATSHPAATTKPQASKSLKEDWMARINRERAASGEQSKTDSPMQAEEKDPLITERSLYREH